MEAQPTNFISGFSSPTQLALNTGGLFIDSNGFNIGTSDTFSGSGNLTKVGSGTFTLSGNNAYNGGTIVENGTLQAGIADAFSSNSSHVVDSGAELDLAGFAQTIASLENNGLVSLQGTTAGNQLTVTGNLLSGTGTFNFLTNLGALTGDFMAIEGTSAGNYVLNVTNQGGLPTGPGQALEIISTTDGVAKFTLASGHVDVGMFVYVLSEGLPSDVSTGDSSTDWYLVNLVPFAMTNEGMAVLASSPRRSRRNVDNSNG